MQRRAGVTSRQDTAPRKGVFYMEPSSCFPLLTPRAALQLAASQRDLSITPGTCLPAARTQGTRIRARSIREGEVFMVEVYWRHSIKMRPNK